MTTFKAYTYTGKKTARTVLNKIEQGPANSIWQEDVALISRNQKGHFKVESNWAQDSSRVGDDVGIGAVTGAILGLFFGPGGALAGAALGSSIGGLIGHHHNVKFNEPVLDDFAASLVNDSSALVFLGTTETIKAFAAAVADVEYDSAAFDAVLDQEAVATLMDKMTSK